MPQVTDKPLLCLPFTPWYSRKYGRDSFLRLLARKTVADLKGLGLANLGYL